MAEKLGGVEIPDLASLQTVKLDFSNMDGSVRVPDDLINKFKTSDVTTVTSVTKEFASAMFAQMSPQLIDTIQNGINSGIDGITSGLNDLNKSITELQGGYDGIGQGITGMEDAVRQQKDALNQLKAYAPMLKGTLPNGLSLADMIPADVKAKIPQSALDTLSAIKSADDLQAQIKSLEGAIAGLNAKIEENKKNQGDMKTALDQMAAAKEEMTTLTSQMEALIGAIPGAFRTAEINYLAEIDARTAILETTYQTTLNDGYRSIYLIVAVSSAAAMAFLAFYRKNKAENN